MVKFAKSDEKSFNPIEKHTVHSIASPAPPPPALHEVRSEPEVKSESQSAKPERPKKSAPKKSSLEKLIAKRPEPAERLTRVVKCLCTPTEEAELRTLVARLCTPTRSL